MWIYTKRSVNKEADIHVESGERDFKLEESQMNHHQPAWLSDDSSEFDKRKANPCL